MKKTPFVAQQSEQFIGRDQGLFTIGSCFSDMIANKMARYKWKVAANPFGTLYDPISISTNLLRAIDGSPPNQELFAVRDDIHVHYHLHSDLSALGRSALEEQIRVADAGTRASLLSANWMVVTLGSMIVFEYKATGSVVANCHKMPHSYFTKRQLTLEEATTAIDNLFFKIKSLNPQIRFILTVSPVRHARHGLAENMLSKSKLRVLCSELQQSHKEVQYFPAYEIMMDDLRDYAYYEADGVHPNELAEDYIWGKFQETYFSSGAVQFTQQWDKILAALHHKPLHSGSSGHQKFLRETIQQLHQLSDVVDTTTELQSLTAQLT